MPFPYVRQITTNSGEELSKHIVRHFSFSYHMTKNNYATTKREHLGRAVAQAISRLLPSAAVRFRSRVKSCEICGGHSGIGVGFLLVLRFPLSLLHYTNWTTIIAISLIVDWYNRQINGHNSSGLGSARAPLEASFLSWYSWQEYRRHEKKEEGSCEHFHKRRITFLNLVFRFMNEFLLATQCAVHPPLI
jgi:hypothetical protein